MRTSPRATQLSLHELKGPLLVAELGAVGSSAPGGLYGHLNCPDLWATLRTGCWGPFEGTALVADYVPGGAGFGFGHVAEFWAAEVVSDAALLVGSTFALVVASDALVLVPVTAFGEAGYSCGSAIFAIIVAGCSSATACAVVVYGELVVSGEARVRDAVRRGGVIRRGDDDRQRQHLAPRRPDDRDEEELEELELEELEVLESWLFERVDIGLQPISIIIYGLV